MTNGKGPGNDAVGDGVRPGYVDRVDRATNAAASVVGAANSAVYRELVAVCTDPEATTEEKAAVMERAGAVGIAYKVLGHNPTDLIGLPAEFYGPDGQPNPDAVTGLLGDLYTGPGEHKLLTSSSDQPPEPTVNSIGDDLTIDDSSASADGGGRTVTIYSLLASRKYMKNVGGVDTVKMQRIISGLVTNADASKYMIKGPKDGYNLKADNRDAFRPYIDAAIEADIKKAARKTTRYRGGSGGAEGGAKKKGPPRKGAGAGDGVKTNYLCNVLSQDRSLRGCRSGNPKISDEVTALLESDPEIIGLLRRKGDSGAYHVRMGDDCATVREKVKSYFDTDGEFTPPKGKRRARGSPKTVASAGKAAGSSVETIAFSKIAPSGPPSSLAKKNVGMGVMRAINAATLAHPDIGKFLVGGLGEPGQRKRYTVNKGKDVVSILEIMEEVTPAVCNDLGIEYKPSQSAEPVAVGGGKVKSPDGPRAGSGGRGGADLLAAAGAPETIEELTARTTGRKRPDTSGNGAGKASDEEVLGLGAGAARVNVPFSIIQQYADGKGPVADLNGIFGDIDEMPGGMSSGYNLSKYQEFAIKWREVGAPGSPE